MPKRQETAQFGTAMFKQGILFTSDTTCSNDIVSPLEIQTNSATVALSNKDHLAVTPT